jgi:hypothetical protein
MAPWYALHVASNFERQVAQRLEHSCIETFYPHTELLSRDKRRVYEAYSKVVMWIEAGELSRDLPATVSLHVGKQREGRLDSRFRWCSLVLLRRSRRFREKAIGENALPGLL